MTTASARKGKEAEREVAALLAARTGWPVRRRLRNGLRDDQGDLDGVPNTTLQVKNYADVGVAVTVGLPAMRRQKVNAGARYGLLLVRRRGKVGARRWVAVMDLDDVARLLVAALDKEAA